ncbi:MAG: hypothetical protein WCO06_07330 [Candidatus Roizmanbacteria bacterium]
MRPIDIRVTPKSSSEFDCEDEVVVTQDYACVIDGQGSKSDTRWEGKTPGIMSKIILKEALSTMPNKYDIFQATEYMTQAINQRYQQLNVLDLMSHQPHERFSSAVAIFSKFRYEVWLFGDCQCLLDGIRYTNSHPIISVLGQARSLFNEFELANGKTTQDLMQKDTGREYIFDMLKHQTLFQNAHFESPYSYVMIDGFPIQKDKLKLLHVTEDNQFIVLATDGYPELLPSLDESENKLKEILNDDPLLIKKYRMSKGMGARQVSFDDRAYVKVEL